VEVDRASHFFYLGQRNPKVALRFDEAVEAALTKIRSNPQIGAKLTLPAVAHLGYRFYRPAGFQKYLVIFRIHDDATYILRILHGSQDIEAALGP
jgi:plasmid stabilization system protein ParE